MNACEAEADTSDPAPSAATQHLTSTALYKPSHLNISVSAGLDAGGTIVQVSSSLGSLHRLGARYKSLVTEAPDLQTLAKLPFEASDRNMRNQMVPTCAPPAAPKFFTSLDRPESLLCSVLCSLDESQID